MIVGIVIGGVWGYRTPASSQKKDVFFRHEGRYYAWSDYPAQKVLFLMLTREDEAFAKKWVHHWKKHDSYDHFFLIDYDGQSASVLKTWAQEDKSISFLKDFDYAPLGFYHPASHPALYIKKPQEILGPLYFYHEVPV